MRFRVEAIYYDESAGITAFYGYVEAASEEEARRAVVRQIEIPGTEILHFRVRRERLIDRLLRWFIGENRHA